MTIEIKLGFHEISNAEAVINGDLYAQGVDGNPYFTGADIIAKGEAVKTASENLKNALDRPKSITKSSGIKIARAKWEKEVSALTKMQELVINSADAIDEEKIKMARSANREVVEHPVRQKYDFTAKRGDNSGEVKFTAATKDAVAHLYTWCTDLETFIDKADPWVSSGAKTIASGVPIGKELAFFHKAIFTKKRMDWEGPIFLTVL
jgi:hypothetical protein